MRLASGLAQGKRFAVIDTEAGRALHYADRFAFDHGDMSPPFSPNNYLEAILAAEQAGYPVIVVDSFSHEHAGEGGILEMHEAELDRMAGDDWKKREACKMTAWIRPKSDHKRMVQRLLQLRSHLILCFRAEPKIAMEKDEKGKTIIIDKGWQPICAKGLEFELTCSFLLANDRPGLPGTALKLPEVLRSVFPADKPISEETGKGILAWAGGASPVDATKTYLAGRIGLVKPPLTTDEKRALMTSFGDCKGAVDRLTSLSDEEFIAEILKGAGR